MMNKKVTRKEFILSALSIAAVFVASKVPFISKDITSKQEEGNAYGNNTYGGSKKNV